MGEGSASVPGGRHPAGALLVGAVVGAALWLALVPWDLSEVDPAGRELGDGGDDQAGAIALVAVVLAGVGLVLAVSERTARVASWFAGGGFAAWATLFAWRAGTAETIGANLYLVPLVTVVVPVALGVPLLLGKLSSALQRRRATRAD